jgi:hypothetical protein
MPLQAIVCHRPPQIGHFACCGTRARQPSRVASRLFRKSIPAAARIIYEGFMCRKEGHERCWTRAAMDVSEFEDLIDRLGEDLTRWPEDRRLAAEALLANSSEARALHEEAKALRQILAAPPVRAPAGLADRIAAAAASQKKVEEAAPSSEGESKPDSVDITQAS